MGDLINIYIYLMNSHSGSLQGPEYSFCSACWSVLSSAPSFTTELFAGWPFFLPKKQTEANGVDIEQEQAKCPVGEEEVTFYSYLWKSTHFFHDSCRF